METFTGIVQEVTNLSCSGWAKWIVIGLRIFAGSGLVAFIGLNIACWYRVTIK